MAAAATLKITEVAISPQRFDRSLRNLVQWCKMGLLTAIKNPRWRTSAILKTVKSPYLGKRLIDFDEIWHADVYWRCTADRTLKFRIFEIPRWRRPPSWKSQKSQYLRNGLTDLYEIWYDGAKWVSYPFRPLKNWISKIQDGGQLPFWKPLNHHISATFWPIVIKFVMMMQVGLQRLT